ncbi:hypothetical protein SEMRO_2767_G336690.1 [Seminavis robusta]|uniref:Uncharacterized protein n=1 Tax=Seminavis robusta TaxID=568900 RepID=A0A9N8EZM2_9STRA|nr:hypothetical protein SEMRO_2767_G336690.1 [Seminavis robusta]|eukprot:Sro2767_g336690.1 n/a (90) ;mRNA; r:9810-10079
MHSTTFQQTTTTGKTKSSQVNLYPYGVGKQEAMLEFEEHKTNPGQGHFIEKRDKRRKDRGPLKVYPRSDNLLGQSRPSGNTSGSAACYC